MAAGSGLFLQGSQLNLSPSSGKKIEINDQIADDTGNGNNSGYIVIDGSESGVVSLNASNTYSGGTTVKSGTLRLGSNTAAGTGTITTTGSVVDYTDGVTIANALVIDSNTTQLQIEGGASAEQSGAISEVNSARPLEKIGGGELTLSADNTYTGETAVSAGRLIVTGKLDSGALTVENFAGLTVDGAALADDAAVMLNGTGDLMLTGDETIGSLASASGNSTVSLGANTLTIGDGTDTSFDGVISGSGELTKQGGGTFTLSADNNYTGDTTITSGTIAVETGGSITDSASLDNDATFEVAGGASASFGTIDNDGTINVDGTLSGTGNTFNNSGTTNVGDGATVDDAGAINNLAGGTFNFNGSGTLEADTDGSGNEAIVNAGTINLTGSTDPSGTVDAEGSKIDNSGTINVDQQMTLANIETLTMTSGKVDVDTNAALIGVDTMVQQGGLLTGGGTFEFGTYRLEGGDKTATIDFDNFALTGGTHNGTVNADITVIAIGGNVPAIGPSGVVAHNAAGAVEVTTTADGDIANGAGDGLNVVTTGGGDITMTLDGKIEGRDDGIAASGGMNDNIEITLTDDVTGLGGHGIIANNYGSGALSITANGTVTGGAEDGIYANSAGTEGITITIAESGGVSTFGMDTEDWAIEADAPNGAVSVNNSGTVTGRVNLSNSNIFTNAGTWDLAGMTSNFNSQGNSLVVNEGLIIAASDGAADEVSTINNLDTFRSNASGTIQLADGAAGDVLRIDADAAGADGAGTGNFVANGGTVELDVVLGGDGSAADRMNISGDVTLDGTPTALAFNAVGGGTGADTTTGIEVVTVGGTSDAGTFVLAEPIEVGLFTYDLSLGWCDGTASQSWYLCGSPGTTVAAFEVMPGVVLGNFAQAQSLSHRLGSRITTSETKVSTRGTDDLSVSRAVGPWMRTSGMQQDVTPETSTSGVSWDSSSFGVEFGLGASLGVVAGGDLVGGLSFGSTSQTTDLENTVGTGQIDMQGRGVGLSLTWFGQDGLYVDLNAGRDWIEVDASAQGAGMLLDGYEDVVNSASGEVGKRLTLEGGTTLVPQVQLAWSQMEDGSFTDSLGNDVTFADREMLTGRVGLAVEQAVDVPDWGAGEVYGFGNVHADLSGDQMVEVAGTDLIQSGRGTWAELGAGFSLSPDGETNLFGEVSYRSAVADVDGSAVSGSLGWRVQW